MLKFYTHFVLKRLQYTFKLSLICCICENSIKYNVNIKDEKINIYNISDPIDFPSIRFSLDILSRMTTSLWSPDKTLQG